MLVDRTVERDWHAVRGQVCDLFGAHSAFQEAEPAGGCVVIEQVFNSLVVRIVVPGVFECWG